MVRSRRCSSESRSCAATSAIRRSSSARSASTRSQTVIHLAAQTIVTIANRNPVSTFETNVGRHLVAARGLPPEPRWSSRSCSPRRTRPTATTTTLPYTEETPLRRAPSLRRQQVVRGSDRAGLRDHLRHAGGHHALRKLLRRRGSQLEPDRARDDPLRRCAASGRSFVRTARSSATTSTSRTGRSPTCCWPRSWRPTRRWPGAPSTFRTRSRSTCAQLVDRILNADGIVR